MSEISWFHVTSVGSYHIDREFVDILTGEQFTLKSGETYYKINTSIENEQEGYLMTRDGHAFAKSDDCPAEDISITIERARSFVDREMFDMAEACIS
jgi:hypothetical protein